MEKSELSRRDFQRLSVAALGGLMAGTSLARADEDEKPKKKDPKKPLLLQDPHVCRGLNASCKGEVGGEKNDCAGKSHCATAEAHSCGGENECAGLGGCGEHPGENKCQGMGKCHVPLMDKAWDKARKNFEAAMKKANKKFGAAPKKKKK
ncbi:MAG TPA: hypothetical protein VMV69_03470 [Pirellulales bacterium]|nr:hypothetical protein [Pirellulales bacterium]